VIDVRKNGNHLSATLILLALLTSAGPRVAEAIFAHVTSAASTVAATASADVSKIDGSQ
jgi:hypothetical protein